MPFCIRYGRLIDLLMIPAMFLPVIGLIVFSGAQVNLTAALSGCVAYIAYEFPYYFSEPIALGPILGVPGTYMGYAAGNTANVCAVATSAALEASGAQSGTPKGTVMSTLAVSVAVATKAVLVFLLSLIGGWCSALSRMRSLTVWPTCCRRFTAYCLSSLPVQTIEWAESYLASPAYFTFCWILACLG